MGTLYIGMNVGKALVLSIMGRSVEVPVKSIGTGQIGVLPVYKKREDALKHHKVIYAIEEQTKTEQEASDELVKFKKVCM